MSYIYLIQCEDSSYYKVGVADEPNKRLEGLQTGCPYRLSLVLTCRFNSRTAATTAEAQIHRALTKYNVHSEWFDLPSDILKDLKLDMVNNSEIDS